MIGTAAEFYDVFIYGTTAALVFGPLFFPANFQAAQTLLTFATFSIGFLPAHENAGWIASALLPLAGMLALAGAFFGKPLSGTGIDQ